MEEEIGVLRNKLKAAQSTLERTRAEMHTQRMRTRQLVMAWKHRLQQKEDKLRKERIQRDRELQEISQQLLFFEGQLKQEQQQIKTMLVEKDLVIKSQNGRIRELTDANTKLTVAIHSFKSRLKSDEPQANRSACSAGSVDFYLGDNMDSDVFVDDAEEYMNHSSSDQSISSVEVKETAATPPHLRVTSAKGQVMTSSPIYRCKSLPECRIEKGEMSRFSFNDTEGYSESPGLSRTRNRSGELEEKVTEFFASNATDTEKERRLVDAAVKHRTPPRGQTNLARSGLNGYGSSPDVHATSSVSKKVVHFQDANFDSRQAQSPPDSDERLKKGGHLRPRDVKKRSMERTRANSLKDEAQPLTNQKATITKKYFSFAF